MKYVLFLLLSYITVQSTAQNVDSCYKSEETKTGNRVVYFYPHCDDSLAYTKYVYNQEGTIVNILYVTKESKIQELEPCVQTKAYSSGNTVVYYFPHCNDTLTYSKYVYNPTGDFLKSEEYVAGIIDGYSVIKTGDSAIVLHKYEKGILVELTSFHNGTSNAYSLKRRVNDSIFYVNGFYRKGQIKSVGYEYKDALGTFYKTGTWAEQDSLGFTYWLGEYQPLLNQQENTVNRHQNAVKVGEWVKYSLDKKKLKTKQWGGKISTVNLLPPDLVIDPCYEIICHIAGCSMMRFYPNCSDSSSCLQDFYGSFSVSNDLLDKKYEEHILYYRHIIENDHPQYEWLGLESLDPNFRKRQRDSGTFESMWTEDIAFYKGRSIPSSFQKNIKYPIINKLYYYKNGKIKSQGNTYIDSLQHIHKTGKWVEYDSVGYTYWIGKYQPELLLQSIDTIFKKDQSVDRVKMNFMLEFKHGYWVQYDRNNKEIKRILYEKGVAVKEE